MNQIISTPSKRCRVCGNVFYKNGTHSKTYWERRLFCSVDCSNKDRIGKNFSPGSQFKKGKPSWNKGIGLSEVHKRRLSEGAKGQSDRNFCNRQCWALGTRGKDSPVFKGEEAVSRLRKRVACLPEYKEWHAKILRRDKWLCVLCGSRENLEVDHIKRFYFIAIENNIVTPEDARNCPELWDLSNGRTLCRKCHRASDTYGTTGLRKVKVLTN